MWSLSMVEQPFQELLMVWISIQSILMLAFTSHGDGPKSSVVVERTMEDGKKLDCLEQFLILKFFFSYRLVLDY